MKMNYVLMVLSGLFLASNTLGMQNTFDKKEEQLQAELGLFLEQSYRSSNPDLDMLKKEERRLLHEHGKEERKAQHPGSIFAANVPGYWYTEDALNKNLRAQQELYNNLSPAERKLLHNEAHEVAQKVRAHKQALEKLLHEKVMQERGSERASDTVQQSMNEVATLYKQHNLLPDSFHVDVYYGDEYMKKKGRPTFMNAFMRDSDCWVSRDEMTEDQRKSLFAHELAHQVFDTRRLVGPRTLYKQLQWHNMLICCWLSGSALAYASYKNYKNTQYRPNLLLTSLSASLILLWKLPDLPVPNVVQKAEEIACDMVAASVLPNGFAAGKQKMERKKQLLPDYKSEDHPSLDTRIACHEVGENLYRWWTKMKV